MCALKMNDYIPYNYRGVGSTRIPNLLTINNTHYKRKGDDQNFLINEALRFFNYRRTRKKINDVTLKDAISRLRVKYHNSLNIKFRHLLCTGCTNNLKYYIHKDKRSLLKNAQHAENGIYAARAFLSVNWRNTKAKNKYYRNFEEISPKLTDLINSINVSKIESYLNSKYTNELNEPFWGGKYTIEPDWDSINYIDKENCFNGIFAKSTDDIGLTEKLNSMYMSQFFHETNQKYKSTPMNRNGFEFLEEIEKKIDYIEKNILPIQLQRTHIWKDWFKALDKLAKEYDTAIHVENGDIGVKVGLPWALVLIGVLKVYLIDLMLRTIMVSLPIYEIYKNQNGNAGIALLEALSGSYSLIDEQKCLDYYKGKETEKFSFILKDWKSTINNPWDDKETSAFFKEMWKKPIIGPKIIEKKLINNRKTHKKKQSYLSIGEFIENEIYNFPVIKENDDFYNISGLNQRKNSVSLNLGIRYITQAHLYVVGTLLAMARNIVDIKDKDSKNRDNFSFIASSLPWGGKFPPHKTHQDGRKVDIGFGTDLIRWPQIDCSQKCITSVINKSSLTLQQKNEYKKNYRTLLKVCYEEKCTKGKILKNSEQVVSRELVRNSINSTINDFISRNITYAEAEKALIGTPHFTNKDGVDNIKMTHIAHLAILLSGPSEIIFASPIVHLRALKALMPYSSSLIIQESLLKTRFAFFPHNHHHHWHVEYVNKDEPDAIKRFENYFDLWQNLDIDFRPFTKYLKRKANTHVVHNNYSKDSECSVLIESLEKYNQYYEKYYNESKARELTKDIFSKFYNEKNALEDEENPYLSPTILYPVGQNTHTPAQSKELMDTFDKTKKFGNALKQDFFNDVDLSHLKLFKVLDEKEMIRKFGLDEIEPL